MQLLAAKIRNLLRCLPAGQAGKGLQKASPNFLSLLTFFATPFAAKSWGFLLALTTLSGLAQSKTVFVPADAFAKKSSCQSCQEDSCVQVIGKKQFNYASSSKILRVFVELDSLASQEAVKQAGKFLQEHPSWQVLGYLSWPKNQTKSRLLANRGLFSENIVFSLDFDGELARKFGNKFWPGFVVEKNEKKVVVRPGGEFRRFAQEMN